MKTDDIKNANYKRLENTWKRIRMALGGNDEIQHQGAAAQQMLVPPLSGQKKEEYDAMIKRATFFNASLRTLDGLVGLVFRKEPDYKWPSGMGALTSDMTLKIDNKQPHDELAEELLEESLAVGRVGVLIDMPARVQDVKNAAEFGKLNLRPYATIYKAETILDWRFARVNNAAQLVMVRLYECVEEWVGVERKSIEQERRLLLTDIGYIQQIWREDEKGNLYQFGGDIIPEMNGKPLPYIPFICDFGDRPPLLDLIDVNIGHFRTDVDLEHGAHFIAVPTPMFAGFEFKDGEAFNLGASGGYSAAMPDAKWGFLEFQGAGLGTLVAMKETKAMQMSVLGARFLEAQSSAAEATDTVRIRKSGELSILADWSRHVSRMMVRILEIMRDWSGNSGDVDYKLNTDYSEAGITADDAVKWFSVVQGGGISQQTYYGILQKGEIYGNTEQESFEAEQGRIESQIGGDIVNQ